MRPTLFLFLLGITTLFSFADKPDINSIPKGDHIVWHDGGENYFAIFENGMLYSVYNNKYHKIHKVHDSSIVEDIFQLLRENHFTELPAPTNKEQVLSADAENFKHIQYRHDGRVYEAYWTDLDSQEDPDFLISIIKKLRGLV